MCVALGLFLEDGSSNLSAVTYKNRFRRQSSRTEHQKTIDYACKTSGKARVFYRMGHLVRKVKFSTACMSPMLYATYMHWKGFTKGFFFNQGDSWQHLLFHPVLPNAMSLP
jgi:hypothetical protein